MRAPRLLIQSDYEKGVVVIRIPVPIASVWHLTPKEAFTLAKQISDKATETDEHSALRESKQ